jgi:hypothetical protein
MKEEEALDSLVDSVNSLINVLRRDSPEKPKAGKCSYNLYLLYIHN